MGPRIGFKKKKENPKSIHLSAAANLFQVLTSWIRRITDLNSVPNVSLIEMNIRHKSKAKEEASNLPV